MSFLAEEMNRGLTRIFGILIRVNPRNPRFSFSALLMMAFSGVALAQDTLTMTNGERRTGRVVGLDAKNFSLQVVLVPGQPPGTIGVPRAAVRQIDFAPDEARDAFLAKATTAQAAQVGAHWTRVEPFVGVARSPAARIGLRYAALLVDSADGSNGARATYATALALFSRIEREAWSEVDRVAAKQGRLRAMLASGKVAEAVAEATELAKFSTDAAVLIEARFILARAADELLRKLVEENPRWEEDDRVRPERHRLFHEAVDLYLYPYLFHGARSEAVARGLGYLVELYRFTGDDQLALETARDLVTLFPETSPAKPASSFIAGLTDEQKAVDFEKEARAAVAPPPTPKTHEKKKK